LLTHTASFADGQVYDDFLMLTYREPLNAPSLKQLLSEGGEFYADGAVYSTNKPGAKYSYSNLAFGLLGTIVEKLSGERFDKYCEQHIFKPLGMTCSFNPADLEGGDQLATLYRPGTNGWEAQFDDHDGERPKDRLGEGYRIAHNALPCAPQGGLRASATDLAKFMRAFTDPAYGESKGILKQESIRLMLGKTPAGKSDEGERPTPLAFHRANRLKEGETWIGHTGSAYGLQSMMFWEKNGPLGFILITSGSRADEDAVFSEMEKEIFEAVIGHLRSETKQVETGSPAN
jgi:CubicO group peptidase (beta-lactamase class C family)